MTEACLSRNRHGGFRLLAAELRFAAKIVPKTTVLVTTLAENGPD